MPKEDYLIKYLEKLGRAVAAMFGFRQKGFPDESIRLGDELFKELWSLNIEEISSMQIEQFTELIRKENYLPSYLESLAPLLHETAKSFSLKGDEKNAVSFYEKSLRLYYLLNEKDKTFSFEREAIISELESITNTTKL